MQMVTRLASIRRALLLLVAAVVLAVPVAAPGHPLDASDVDHDQKLNVEDNCPERYNPRQEDTDEDSQRVEAPNGQLVYVPPGTPASPPPTTGGDKCDTDDDNDLEPDATDNCDKVVNPGQEDFDLDGEGDVCDFDDDGDGALDEEDNCAYLPNPSQLDSDRDGIGDACDPDAPTDQPIGALPGFDPNDKLAPKPRIRVKRRLRMEAVQAGIVVGLRCSEGCVASATLKAGRSTLGTGGAAIHAKGRTFVFVRYAKGASARLRSSRRVRAILRLRVADASGNSAKLSRRITLKR